jgi:hypothetical protein
MKINNTNVYYALPINICVTECDLPGYSYICLFYLHVFTMGACGGFNMVLNAEAEGTTEAQYVKDVIRKDCP